MSEILIIILGMLFCIGIFSSLFIIFLFRMSSSIKNKFFEYEEVSNRIQSHHFQDLLDKVDNRFKLLTTNIRAESQRYAETDKEEIKEGIKEEIKEGIKKEIKEEIKEEIKKECIEVIIIELGKANAMLKEFSRYVGKDVQKKMIELESKLNENMIGWFEAYKDEINISVKSIIENKEEKHDKIEGLTITEYCIREAEKTAKKYGPHIDNTVREHELYLAKEKRKKLRESLAELCHEQWSGWMEYLFEKGEFQINGTWIMPGWAVKRWTRQSEEIYSNLSLKEKESDRSEADRFIKLFEQEGE